MPWAVKNRQHPYGDGEVTVTASLGDGTTSGQSTPVQIGSDANLVLPKISLRILLGKPGPIHSRLVSLTLDYLAKESAAGFCRPASNRDLCRTLGAATACATFLRLPRAPPRCCCVSRVIGKTLERRQPNPEALRAL